MGTYLAAAGQDVNLARKLYVWDRDISAAVLADVAIIEVALRNSMAKQLHGKEPQRFHVSHDQLWINGLSKSFRGA